MKRDLLKTDINNKIVGRKERATKKTRTTRQKKLVVLSYPTPSEIAACFERQMIISVLYSQ